MRSQMARELLNDFLMCGEAIICDGQRVDPIDFVQTGDAIPVDSIPLNYVEFRRFIEHEIMRSLGVPVTVMENTNTNAAGSALIFRPANFEAKPPNDTPSDDQTF